MRDIITLLRPHQYIKNLFIFAPAIFAFNFSLDVFEQLFYTFLLFSMVASSIYVVNDLLDVEEDKKHPTKKYRPIASGGVSKKEAKLIVFILSGFVFLTSFLFNIKLFFVLCVYFILNILYSYKLKHIAIVDIFIISTGFVLRLFAGALVVNIELSMWIIIITFLLAIFLSLAKRRDDVLLSLSGKETRKNIDGYNLEFVNSAMVLMAGVVIVSYIQYTVSPEVIERIGTSHLYLSAFFVILGILRYMQITFVEQKSGSPTKIVLKDRFLQITILLWLVSFIVLVMGGK